MKSMIPFLCLLAATLTVRGAEASGHQAAPTELHRAIDRGDRPAWNRMLREGADVTAHDANGNTPLHLAALHGQVDCVRALLDHGADANATNNARATPLLYGITDLEIVRLLLDHKGDPNAKAELGMTPLLAAVSRGQSYDVAKLLIEAGADVQVTREGPWDGGALFRALQAGDQRTIELLFSKGVGIEATGKSFSPLHMAAMIGTKRGRFLLPDNLWFQSAFAFQIESIVDVSHAAHLKPLRDPLNRQVHEKGSVVVTR